MPILNSSLDIVVKRGYIMKTIKSVLPKAGMIFLIFTLLCGVIYTGVVTGIAHLFSRIMPMEVSLK